MGSKRSKEKDEGGKKLALELSILPSSALENTRALFFVEYDCMHHVLSSGLGLERWGQCLSPGSGTVCATSALHGLHSVIYQDSSLEGHSQGLLNQYHIFF